jgi:hypothetical protein
MSSAPIPVESLSAGTILCFRTNQELAGRALMKNFELESFQLQLDILTWAFP